MKKHDLIWGRHPILEALQSGLPLVKIFLQEGARGSIIDKLKRKARQNDVPVERISRAFIDSQAPGQRHQGVVARMEPFTYLTVADLLQNARAKQGHPFLLLLDHLQDPQNFGSLLRTADAAGLDGVIIPRDRACGVTPAVFKSSAGAAAHIPLARTVNLAREMDYLKKEGFWLAGADMSADLPYFDADFNLPLVLLLGSEGKGLSRLLRQKCDFLVHIPLAGRISSLNVAVAGSIIIYEAFAQRRKQKGQKT
ncbi:MAG: 23S rRNA (guanosine(2251)-2'-O)-methyltransferase RlmB [Firmicutes bacterium]|nr:23S rRNA (guanosine(2251)-2'-O)-methyltransferase RlmB [Bacillota bacterium]